VKIRAKFGLVTIIDMYKFKKRDSLYCLVTFLARNSIAIRLQRDSELLCIFIL